MEDFGTRFRLVELQQGPYRVLVASNEWALPVTVQLTLDGANIVVLTAPAPGAAPLKLKTLHVLPAYSSDVTLAAVCAADPALGWSMTFAYRGAMGSEASQHDAAVLYRYPFDGPPRMCGQSFGGKFSHSDIDTFHSIDFLMPIGTPVVAARRGTVLATRDSMKGGGTEPMFKDRANYVWVAHSDGSVAAYVHLRHQGVAVAVGDVVQEGQLLGHSGNSGFSQAPHLHFSIMMPRGKPQAWPTASFAFADVTGNPCVPCKGYEYPGGPSLDVANMPPPPWEVAGKAPAGAGAPPPVGAGRAGPVKRFGASTGNLLVPAKQAAAPVNVYASPALPPAPHRMQPAVPPQQQQQPQYVEATAPPPSNYAGVGGPYAAPPTPVPVATPPPAKEWTGKYAPPGLLPVPPKPPAVNRTAKPQRDSQGYTGQPLYDPYAQPQQPPPPGQQPYYDAQQQPYQQPYYDAPQYQTGAPPPGQQPYYGQAPQQPYYAQQQPPGTPGIPSSMTPGVRSAPPSAALHPELQTRPTPVATATTPDGKPVVNSMTPGYQRETNFIDETKRTLDVRRHNPVKKAGKRMDVALPNSKEFLHGFGLN